MMRLLPVAYNYTFELHILKMRGLSKSEISIRY